MTKTFIKIKIPKWWADILNRTLQQYGTQNSLSVNTPFGSDYRNMEDFWEDLDEELGYDLYDWCEKNLPDEAFNDWEYIWHDVSFVLAYLNKYSRHLFEVVEHDYTGPED